LQGAEKLWQVVHCTAARDGAVMQELFCGEKDFQNSCLINSLSRARALQRAI